jgi:hypothetical protein
MFDNLACNFRMWSTALLVFAIAILLSACGTAQLQTPTLTAEIPTDTPIPSDTPVPTLTPTSTGTVTPTPTLTLTPKPTENAAATRTAKAEATREKATSKILEEMRLVGLPTDGELVWYSADDQQLDISLTKYMEMLYVPVNEDRLFKDFILRAEVSWNSQTGLAGCGVIFRATPPLDNGLQYRLFFMRLSGAPAWDIEYWKNNEFLVNLMGSIKFNNSINLDQDATNIYYLQVQGDQMTVYANGARIGTTAYDKLDEGQLAFFASQESGKTVCAFTNVYIFELK